MDALQHDIAEWSDGQFGAGERREGMLAHLRNEITELFEAWEEGDTAAAAQEAADCAMLLTDFVEHSGYSIHRLMRAKLEVNKRRKWGTVAVDGSIEHIREEDRS